LESGLREAGFANVVLVKNTIGLIDQVYRIDPDAILIDLENPSRDVLEQVFQFRAPCAGRSPCSSISRTATPSRLPWTPASPPMSSMG
jgi:hypothetical protein